jgi:hypothetical protein
VAWGGMNLPNIPYLHQGGIVPGSPGQNVLTMLQAGERVLPAAQSRAGVTVIVQGNVYGGPAGIDELSDMIALRMRVLGA